MTTRFLEGKRKKEGPPTGVEKKKNPPILPTGHSPQTELEGGIRSTARFPPPSGKKEKRSTTNMIQRKGFSSLIVPDGQGKKERDTNREKRKENVSMSNLSGSLYHREAREGKCSLPNQEGEKKKQPTQMD